MFSATLLLTPAQTKPKSFESRWNFKKIKLKKYQGWMRLMFTCVLNRGCFHSFTSTRTFRKALTALVDSYAGDKECPFSGVTKSSRVWREVPESDARSVHPRKQCPATNTVSASSSSTEVEAVSHALRWIASRDESQTAHAILLRG